MELVNMHRLQIMMKNKLNIYQMYLIESKKNLNFESGITFDEPKEFSL